MDVISLEYDTNVVIADLLVNRVWADKVKQMDKMI